MKEEAGEQHSHHVSSRAWELGVGLWSLVTGTPWTGKAQPATSSWTLPTGKNHARFSPFRSHGYLFCHKSLSCQQIMRMPPQAWWMNSIHLYLAVAWRIVVVLLSIISGPLPVFTLGFPHFLCVSVPWLLRREWEMENLFGSFFSALLRWEPWL